MRHLIANIAYWVTHPKQYKDAKSHMKKASKSLQTEDDVKTYYSQFNYKDDVPFDWRPWVVTVFARDYVDDCDGAAVLALWCLKQIGLKGQYWSLKGEPNHAIVVCKNKVYSNGRVYNVANEEQGTILSLFQYKYSDMKKRKVKV